jgi:hypothetical protein
MTAACGPHLASQGLPPCIHHTFCHAKAIAGAVHSGARLDAIDVSGRLPRESQPGVRRFPEIDVALAAAGPWRATITHAEEEGRVVVAVEARLENEAADSNDPPAIRIRYALDSDTFEIAATGLPSTARLVLETPGRCRRIPTARPRTFNHVPGFEAVPFEILPDPTGTAIARLRVPIFPR